ncbi:1-deoxy-D-xylulose-5-phosphate synthase [Actinomyces sp. zg-332]|uniref:1-deoxy-D-xylulose-5-phosphate synthase n=1 Tax=Actinomyces sp. zg-332 TaxID=2708340 RepID=UPI001422D1A1|nr:1-deoxy-D-xylulose-5-phosphate synthase [Actinomyces sp. zg-332]QPK94516.1 1-deoxy-D-xylulose-5-phosphate synthase [Actinomyces sp. zg-332]
MHKHYKQIGSVTSPEDLKSKSNVELRHLCAQIRDFLVQNVSKTGGHLGPNLGVVELTVALHKVFNSPTDTIIFDTGHQAYVHKILTGRQDFTDLRKKNGLSGYPSRAESEHDVVENSHASTALAWADGVSRAKKLQGDDSAVIAIIGDGALTGGLAWESINNISEVKNRKLIIVVNDNGRSYAPTVGGLAKHFDSLRSNVKYENFKDGVKKHLKSIGKPGKVTYDLLHGVKEGFKDIVTPKVFFEHLGIKYVGPVDGHNLQDLEEVFIKASEFNEPIIIHAITSKGRGYTPAEQNKDDCFHAVGKIHPETGLPIVASRFGWTSVFADEIVKIGRENPSIVAITAAMLQPVGLKNFAKEFPDRTFDVGIAEAFGATFSAGLSFKGLHPVFALYSTFLNRAYDQVLFDVALHNENVTFVLDRSGITGDDGASHNGMWDMALFRSIPHIQINAPRDEKTLRLALREATSKSGATLVRYPKGNVGNDIEVVEKYNSIDILYKNADLQGFLSDSVADSKESSVSRVVVVAMGAFAGVGIELAEKIVASSGKAEHEVIVVDPRWVWPVSSDLIDIARKADLVVTLEDGLVQGGIGSGIREELANNNVFVPLKSFGIPDEFLLHQSRSEVIEEVGLEVEAIFAEIEPLLS